MMARKEKKNNFQKKEMYILAMTLAASVTVTSSNAAVKKTVSITFFLFLKILKTNNTQHKQDHSKSTVNIFVQ